MRSLIRLLLCLILLPIATLSAEAQLLRRDKERVGSEVEDATEVLSQFGTIPERAVPPALLQKADAVVIIPRLVKVGFVVAGYHGKGVLLRRNADGGWSPPVLVKMTGGSFGAQAGVQGTDLVLVLRSKRSLERILQGNGKVTLGADASVAAGPIGRQVGAGTDVQLRGEILSYARTRGLFAGVSVDGGTLAVDEKANRQYYGKNDLRVEDVLNGRIAVPQSGLQLLTTLARYSGPIAIAPTTPFPPSPSNFPSQPTNREPPLNSQPPTTFPPPPMPTKPIITVPPPNF